MNSKTAVARLYALAQESRLAVFRLLVQRGPEGLPAGEIAARLKVPQATMSFHLKELSSAGLLKSRQEGRFIYYAPDYAAMRGVVDYLMEKCCAENGSKPGECCG
jgi:ArsR family transcriptional regulator, arsenate/arsenite/antimonite-responsive transcriptional repressor